MDIRSEPYISLCSGVGGLDVGIAYALGRRAVCVCYVEHAAEAAAVLAARIEGESLDPAPVWDDLHTFDARPFRDRIRGIAAGYPCQPFSLAGKRAGTNDPRHLWPRISDVIDQTDPDWVIFENVPGHISLGYFDTVRPELEGKGFRIAEGLFSASEVGAPHRRERLFIVGHRRDVEIPSLDDPVSVGRCSGDDQWRYAADVNAPNETFYPGVFPPGPDQFDEWRRIADRRPDIVPTAEPAVYRLVNGMADGLDVSKTARIRMAGNGVVPQTAELAIRTLWGGLVNG
jgi:DNA (cytosine-5)-methyltransferase 1